MVGNALDHGGLAGAADAFLTGKRNVQARVEQGLEDVPPGFDHDSAVRAGKNDGESAAAGVAWLSGGEVFDMDPAGRTASASRLEAGEHRGWTAAIKIDLRIAPLDDGGDVEWRSAGLVIEIAVERATAIRGLSADRKAA